MVGWRKTWQMLRSHHMSRLLALSVLIGLVAGMGALAFNFVLDLANHLFLVETTGFVAPQPGGEGGTGLAREPAHRWLLLVIPAVGGLAAGYVAYRFAPEARGEGTDAMIRSFHRDKAVMRKRVPLVKTLATALTIGSGGSAGREGPIGQIGAAFGANLARWLGCSEREQRLLLVAGAGAGIGAVFRSPLGAAFYVVEVLYRDIEFEVSALVPSFVASITAYSLYCSASGNWGAIFTVPPLHFTHPIELPLYALLGLVCALLGMLYVRILRSTQADLTTRWGWPRYFMPALGGLVIGVMGFFLPQVLGMGYGWVQLAIEGGLPLKLLIVLAIAKMVATGITVGSGGSGGLFAPSMVIGGLIGAAFGAAAHQLAPGAVENPASFALVGMAGFFAGVAKVPVASLIMVSEMSLGYGLLVPLMLVTALGYVFTPKRISIYENQVDARVDSPAHEGEFVIDVLEASRVREVITTEPRPTVFQRATALPVILEAVAGSRQEVFPVVDETQRLCGVIDFQDIRIFFTEHELPSSAVVAQDLLAPAFTAVTIEEDLASALRKFRRTRLEELPVIQDEQALVVVAMLSRRDVIAAYHDRMYRRDKS